MFAIYTNKNQDSKYGQFLAGVIKYKNNCNRINLFARLFSIADDDNINDEGVNQFALTIRFLVRKKSLGSDVKLIGVNPESTYSPYVRAFEYFRQLFEGRISYESYDLKRKEMESYKLVHESNSNGIINDDVFLEFIMKNCRKPTTSEKANYAETSRVYNLVGNSKSLPQATFIAID
jgi:hypothetical protein